MICTVVYVVAQVSHSRICPESVLILHCAELIIQSTTPEDIMETAKNFLMEQTKQGSPKGRKTRPQEALAKVWLLDVSLFCSNLINTRQSDIKQSRGSNCAATATQNGSACWALCLRPCLF